MRVLVLGALCLSLAARPADAQEKTSISVTVPVPKAKAYERVMAAFMAEELTVGAGSSADGGVIVAEPIQISKFSFRFHIIYRANFASLNDSSTVVVLRANSRNFAAEDRGGTTGGTSQEKPVASTDRGEFKKQWERLERIAAALQPPVNAGQ